MTNTGEPAGYDDKCTLYKDEDGQYRWRRVDRRNGKEVGGATEGYVAKEDAVANFERDNPGFVLVDETD